MHLLETVILTIMALPLQTSTPYDLTLSQNSSVLITPGAIGTLNPAGLEEERPHIDAILCPSPKLSPLNPSMVSALERLLTSRFVLLAET